MAIQCCICSEILVDREELHEVRRSGPSAVPGRRGLAVYADFCPECFGFVSSDALLRRAADRPMAAA